jgi:outer membrane protein
MRRYGRAAALLLVAVVVPVFGTGASAQDKREGIEGGPELTLDQAVRRSLEGNRELQGARLELVSADGRVREAWSAVYPTVNLSGTYTRNIDVPGQFLPAQIFDPNAAPGEMILVRFGADNNWSGQMRLEQPLFQASALIGVGAAGQYRGLQAEVVRGRTQEVVTRTKQRYFDVLLAVEGERLNEESVRRVRQALEETRAMHRAGMVSDYDVLRLEVELANLEPALRRARNTAEAARRALAVELALEGTEEVRVAGSLSGVDVGEGASDPLTRSFGVPVGSGATLQELMERARANRSELRQIQATQQLRNAELRAEQSEYLPRVSFFATYGVMAQANGGINPFGFGDARSSTSPQAGLTVSVPVFAGFRRPARIDQLRASLAQTQAQGRLAVAQVENQIETLFDQAEEARLRAEAQQGAREQARRGYNIASIQFREGLGSRLELTDAELALRQSEFNYAQAVHDYLTARAQLDLAVGEVPEAM